MNLLKVRITITADERKLLLPSLQSLRIGLVSAAGGDFPDRYAHGLGMYHEHFRQDRKFDVKMANTTIALSERFASFTSSRRIWLDVFDLSVAAFALRIAKHTPEMRQRVNGLARKLEKYRKRAKRRGEAAWQD